MQRRNELESLGQVKDHLAAGGGAVVVQGVDLGELTELNKSELSGWLFVGCLFADPAHEQAVREQGGQIFPRLEGLPYDPYRTGLYTAEELMMGYEDGGYPATRDFAIYAHGHRERYHPDGISIREALAQRIHDHAIDDALGEFLAENSGVGVVGVMGGHGAARSDPWYKQVARTAWLLARKGYLVVTGGGPGVMEAANLGAWLAGYDDASVIDSAIGKLSVADTFSGGEKEGTPEYLNAIRAYLQAARDCVAELSDTAHPPATSLAVPTWFYGHEPSNLFATAVAKYFDNSIREEGLLAMATAGVVYAPGSAGTTQEIFQDLTQNHYATYGIRSPMVFLSRERYQAEYGLIRSFAEARGMTKVYGDLLALVDSAEEAVDFIASHPPRPAVKHKPLYELLES